MTAPTRPGVPGDFRARADRPLDPTYDHLGAAFLPADAFLDLPIGHVFGHPREAILRDGADAEGRPVGHMLGHRIGEPPPADLGLRPAGHVLGSLRGPTE